MAATLQSIKNKIGTLNIVIDREIPADDPDNFFTVRYHRHALTAKHEEAAREAVRDDRALGSLVEMMVPVLVDWDLKADPADDAPIPITKEALVDNVPSSILMMILEQIGEAQSPNTNGTGKP